MKKCIDRKKLKDFKEKLLNLKESTLEEIKDISEDTLMKSQKEMSGDMSGYSIHMADVATDNYEREFNLGLVSDERKTLLEIEEALKRIEDKEYGVCHKCEKTISLVRLNAIPYVRYCKKCQEVMEKENRV